MNPAKESLHEALLRRTLVQKIFIQLLPKRRSFAASIRNH